MGIFKGNDIRGIYGKNLKDEDAYKIGRAFVKFLKAKEIIIARDNRLSSPALTRALIKGILDAGANVIDIGMIDSPGLYFASHYWKKPGIITTASHNPPKHNGFYLVKEDAVSIYQDNGLKKIEQIYKKNKLSKIDKGLSLKKINIEKPYLKHILSFININKIKPMRIVIDAGNGVGAIMARKMFEKFPQIKVIPLFFESDGTYPNRSPDTSIPENLKKLCQKVKKEKANFGIAFDGDADRVAFVDEKGQVIEGSLIGALLVQNMLRNNKEKEKIIYTIGCSKIVPETIKEMQAIPIREKVGHSFVNASMRRNKALFGIEHTGHYFYKDNFYAESPFITSLLVLKLLSSSNKTISNLIAPYKKYYSTGEISFHAKNQSISLNKIKKELNRIYNKKIDTFDGLFLDLGNYWFRIRASQTEPLIRLAIEGKSKSIVDKVRRWLVSLIKKQV